MGQLGYINSSLRDERLAVVGATSPLGKHLIDALLAAGYPVLGLYRSAAKLPARWKQHAGFQGSSFDLADPATAAQSLTSARTILWLAHSREHQNAGQDANAFALQAVCGQRVPGERKIILISTGGMIYGNPSALPVSEDHPCRPLNAYGQSKQRQEEALRSIVERTTGLSGVVLRCANIYGRHYLEPGSWGCIGAFVHSILASEPVPLVAGGMAVRDFVHVDDVIQAILAAIACKQRFAVWNVGSGTGTKIIQLLEMICEIMGRAVPGVIGREAPATDVKESILDIGKIEKESGWRPRIKLREGLEAMLLPQNQQAGARG